MDIGIIKNIEDKLNRDGDIIRPMLQVELLDDDVRTVELMTQSGEDTKPAIGSRVYVIGESEAYKLGIATSDDLKSEVDPGEKEIYSTDSPATTKMARIKLNADGNIDLNANTDNAVSWADLNTALQNMLTALNADIVVAGGAGSTTLDLSSAKVDSVRLP